MSMRITAHFAREVVNQDQPISAPGLSLSLSLAQTSPSRSSHFPPPLPVHGTNSRARDSPREKLQSTNRHPRTGTAEIAIAIATTSRRQRANGSCRFG
ncbi:hypothetical protein FOVSG1_001732 [Fusarium oxysporum f. sp. vasinfectum]